MHARRQGTIRLAVAGAGLALLLAACGEPETEQETGAVTPGNEPSSTTMSGDNIGDASAPPEEQGDAGTQSGQQ